VVKGDMWNADVVMSVVLHPKLWSMHPKLDVVH